MEAQEENLERLMRSTVRALEEQAEHMSQMAEQIAKVADKGRRGGEYMSKSRSALQKAQQVRKLLMTEVKSSKAAASRSASL